MQDIKSKLVYIYFHIDGLYLFLSNKGVNDHARRCIIRRIFILLDSYFEMISFFKNMLYRHCTIDQQAKSEIEKKIQILKNEWDKQYDVIRNKFSAHHQEFTDINTIEWWNEIDYTTITYFYEGICDQRALLAEHADILTYTPVDYEDIDFSDTCLKEFEQGRFYLAHDRLAITKQNTTTLYSYNKFQRKCMLIATIIDFIFINCALTVKTQNYKTYYKKILFDSAWLLLCCDICSLIENMYKDSTYDASLLTLCPENWNGKSILRKAFSNRDYEFESNLWNLRNKFAAHIDVTEKMFNLLKLYDEVDLSQVHNYCVNQMQQFQKACMSDFRTSMFATRDQLLPDDIVDISYSGYRGKT